VKKASQLRSSLERTRLFYFMTLSLSCFFLSSLAGASDRCGSVDRIKIAMRLTDSTALLRTFPARRDLRSCN
jgi:hypothetical protein